MNYSLTGKQLTEQFEGCELTAYQDQVGVWTIGYGHTAGVAPGMTCTQDQAAAWLDQDVQWAVNVVNHAVTVPVTQGEFDAMVDFVFNLGSGNFESSTLLKLLNSGNYDGAAAQFPRWDLAGGKVSAGLLRRRMAEQAEFNGNGGGNGR
ncbi:lysozyme [Burkholderia sp. BCC1998]|uniref:lysozyme n=1 Tax=Burkholderia sp. BCC1998 TaxID=2817447 RepID=UPI002AB74666|nr:lysozyme [Burkholderia sp. BCC1998]